MSSQPLLPRDRESGEERASGEMRLLASFRSIHGYGRVMIEYLLTSWKCLLAPKSQLDRETHGFKGLNITLYLVPIIATSGIRRSDGRLNINLFMMGQGCLQRHTPIPNWWKRIAPTIPGDQQLKVKLVRSICVLGVRTLYVERSRTASQVHWPRAQVLLQCSIPETYAHMQSPHLLCHYRPGY